MNNELADCFVLFTSTLSGSVACLPDVVLPERHERVDHLVVVVSRLRVPHEGSEDINND